jgi:spermidine synthase
MGDARLSLESEPLQQFDVFAVDAFVSDAIPIHLLTREAFDLYWRHLKPDGVLVVHISNRYVDLAPIVATAAEANGKTVRIVTNGSDITAAVSAATWMLVTSRPGFFERPALQGAFPRSRTCTSRPSSKSAYRHSQPAGGSVYRVGLAFQARRNLEGHDEPDQTRREA